MFTFHRYFRKMLRHFPCPYQSSSFLNQRPIPYLIPTAILTFKNTKLNLKEVQDYMIFIYLTVLAVI